MSQRIRTNQKPAKHCQVFDVIFDKTVIIRNKFVIVCEFSVFVTYTTSLSCSTVSGAGFMSTYEIEFCWSFSSSATEIGGYTCHSKNTTGSTGND